MRKEHKMYHNYMFFVGFANSLVYFLQAYKIFQEKEASDVSFAGFLIGFFSVISWLIYGVLLKNKALIYSNVMCTIGAGVTIFGILIYS